MSKDIYCRYKITPTYTVKYYTYDTLRPPPGRPPNSNLSDGYLSAKAMSRLKERVNFMIYMSKEKKLMNRIKMSSVKYKLVFLTLTLSSAQIHSDREIKSKLLQPFLRRLKSRYQAKNYVWKAEAQNNGNIHFHIVTHVYIHWQDLRNTWNDIQETLGYITRSESNNPNSTDIHAVYKEKNPAGYMAKELGKKDHYKDSVTYEPWKEHYYKDLLEIKGCDLKTRKEVEIKRGIEGKLYDCNIELKEIKCNWKQHIHIDADLEKSAMNGNRVIPTDFFQIFTHPLPTNEYFALKTVLNMAIEESFTKLRR